MDAKDEFAVRYYQWALLDSREEMEAGFPFVRRLGNESTMTYLSVMDRLDEDKRELLLVAFAKRFHPQAVELLDDSLTREEETLLEWADAQRFEMICAELVPPLRISSRKLENLLKSELRERFGQKIPFRKTGPRMFLFESGHGPWVVTTRFECGRHRDYYHHIDSGEISLGTSLSIESWMGISAVTGWTHGPASSEENIAETMVDAVQRFLDHVPALLEGLSPDE